METPSNYQDSSIEQNINAFVNLSEEICYNINRLRFRSKEFMQNMASHIHNNNDPNNLWVSFPELQKNVHYYSASNLTNFINFLQENMITNQILQDFTFPPKMNEGFISGFSRIISENKGLGLCDNPVKLRLEIPSKFYYGYYIESIPLKSIENLLIFIIFEEYMILTTKMQANYQENEKNLRSNFVFEYNDAKLIDCIPFLSNIYNTILIYPEQINNNEHLLYNLYILLLSELVDENVNQTKKDNNIKNRTSMNLEVIPEKKEKTTTYLSSVGKYTKKIPLVPSKYDNLWSTHLQIPLKSIERLVSEMDTNNDMKVTLRDIIEFSHSKFIHLNEDVPKK